MKTQLWISHEVVWPPLTPEHPPYDYRPVLGRRKDVWRRTVKALWLISQGFALGSEIQYLIAGAEGIKAKSGAMGRILPRMVTAGILRQRLTPINGRKRMRIVALTDSGRNLTRRLGWTAVQNELERMEALHERGKMYEDRHTLAVLYFIYHARLRSFETSVMPPVIGGRFAPDAAIAMNGNLLYVEVERTGHNKAAKWQNMLTYQSRIAFCGRTRKHRRRLVDEVRWDFDAPGHATDLETLVKTTWLPDGGMGPLWAEEWE